MSWPPEVVRFTLMASEPGTTSPKDAQVQRALEISGPVLFQPPPLQDRELRDAEIEQEHRQIGLVDLLRHLHRQKVDIDTRIDRVVSEARQAGATWAAIGDALKISAQAAYQRWSEEGNAKHAQRQRALRLRETSNKATEDPNQAS